MSRPPFRVLALAAGHDRTAFNSGSELLDRYLRTQVTQDIRRRVTACFVALADEHRIAGYYTLASAGLMLANLPSELGRRLPRHPTVHAVCMGRLAVDREFQGEGLGGALLADALVRAANPEIAAYALVVDALNSPAEAFYQHHGFIPLPDSPDTLFLPLAAFENRTLR